jgi:hypothetical protein
MASATVSLGFQTIDKTHALPALASVLVGNCSWELVGSLLTGVIDCCFEVSRVISRVITVGLHLNISSAAV